MSSRLAEAGGAVHWNSPEDDETVRLKRYVGPSFVGAKVLGHFTGWETVISPFIMIVSVVFSGAVGVFFGWYPASKAAATEPIDALRFE